MRFNSLLTFVLLISTALHAQQKDTLRINLTEADSLLQVRNLSLLASRYEVDMAEARKVQEKLFSNPELYTELSLYNPTTQQWMDVGSSGQKIIQLQKIFRIAGQRTTSIRIAEEDKHIAEWQYYELVRSLRYELHVSFYRYYYLNNAIANIRSRLVLLKNLINVYEEQYVRGNISLQELTRLKSTYFDINNQVNSTQTELVKLQSELQLLIADNRTIDPIVSIDGTFVPSPGQTLQDLIDRSLENRPELKEAQTFIEQSKLRYSLERKEAIPNLTAGMVYDQAGSYVPNYTGVSFGLQIPIFHRNQGRIQEAKIAIDRSNTLWQSKQLEVTREVESAWKVNQLLSQQFQASGADFEAQLDLLSRGLVSNYSKNNISLLEFTDMFEAYNSSIIQLNQLKADLNQSYEELNYAVGEDLSR